MKLHRLLGGFALLLASLCFSGIASAQQAWDTNVLTWSNPTTCTTGEPIAQCAITSVRVEESSTPTGTWRSVVTLPTIGSTYTHVGVSAGQHCYRVLIDSARGSAAPSNVSCKTNTKPVGPPNPATNLIVSDPVAYDVRPNESTFAFERGRAVGLAKLGAACDETRTTGEGFFALERPSRAKILRQPRSAALVARCSQTTG